MEIRPIDKVDLAASIVRSQPGTLDVQIENHRITAELAGEDADIATLLEQPDAADVRMILSDQDPMLKDVFMLATKAGKIDGPTLKRKRLDDENHIIFFHFPVDVAI